MTTLRQRLGLTRYEADEYYATALDAYRKRDFDTAIEQIDYAITLLPLHSEYYAARGLFQLEQNALDDARDSFAEALRLHEGEVLANYGMGVLAYRDKKWEDALLSFEKARAVNPLQPEPFYYIALIYHRQQDNATAIAYMEQAVALMTEGGHKNKTDISNARSWLREFNKLDKQANQQTPETDDEPQQLPIDGERLGILVSREELASGERPALAAGESSDNDEDDEEEEET
jgi:tetratricopeptide (TPR) repeat protein